jgi:hypothetical protein
LQVSKARTHTFSRRQSGLRVGLVFLCVSAALVGLWALLAPRSFYDDFPGLGMNWVRALPRFNQHLARDVGALNLGFALLFGWAAASLDRRLVRAASCAWLVYAIPHLIFHLFHLDQLATAEAVMQTLALVAVVVVPLMAVFATGGRQDRWQVKNPSRWGG